MDHSDKICPIAWEVKGPFGMFADPASGSEATSYPLPPVSACLGMIRAVASVPSVDVEVVAVATTTFPRWMHYAYNSRTPFRNHALLKSNSAAQIREAVLFQPSFQILAILSNSKQPSSNPERFGNVNHAHAMEEIFVRRLRKGQTFRHISLGRREFHATYFGAISDEVCMDYSTCLPSMIIHGGSDYRYPRTCLQNVMIKNGVLQFSQQYEATLRDGRLAFADPRLQYFVTRQPC